MAPKLLQEVQGKYDRDQVKLKIPESLKGTFFKHLAVVGMC